MTCFGSQNGSVMMPPTLIGGGIKRCFCLLNGVTKQPCETAQVPSASVNIAVISH